MSETSYISSSEPLANGEYRYNVANLKPITAIITHRGPNFVAEGAVSSLLLAASMLYRDVEALDLVKEKSKSAVTVAELDATAEVIDRIANGLDETDREYWTEVSRRLRDVDLAHPKERGK